MSSVLPFEWRADVEAELYPRSRATTARVEQAYDYDGRRILTHGRGGYSRGCRCPACTDGARTARAYFRALRAVRALTASELEEVMEPLRPDHERPG